MENFWDVRGGKNREKTVAHAALKGYRVVRVVDDVAWGLNTKRRGLMRRVKSLKIREIDRVFNEYPDLCRK